MSLLCFLISTTIAIEFCFVHTDTRKVVNENLAGAIVKPHSEYGVQTGRPYHRYVSTNTQMIATTGVY